MRADVDDIISKNDATSENRKRATKAFLKNLDPDVWNINKKNNQEIRFEVDFNKYLIAVSQELSIDKDRITVFEFYTAVSLLKERADKNN